MHTKLFNSVRAPTHAHTAHYIPTVKVNLGYDKAEKDNLVSEHSPENSNNAG